MRLRRSLCCAFVTILCSLFAVPPPHAAKRPTVAGELKRLAADGHARRPRTPPPSARSTTTRKATVEEAHGHAQGSSSAASSATSRAWPRAASSRPSRLPALFLTLQRNVEYWSVAAAARRRRAAQLPRLRARLPALSRPRHPDPVARDVRQAQRLLERRQALRRAGRRAARRGAAAGHRARRRARVGVPVPVRRPDAAVGQLARPGHRPAGDGARAPRGCSARPTSSRSRCAGSGSSRPRRPRACASPTATAPTTCSTPGCRT